MALTVYLLSMCRLQNKMLRFLSAFLVCSFFFYSCRHDKESPISEPAGINGYPLEIGQIFINRCATAGCHNSKSNIAAGRLNLESWDDLFKGGRGNAAVIPYSPDESTVLLFANTYTDLGVSVPPTMPYGQQPLSREEIMLLRNWISEGAKSDDGKIAFPELEVKRKMYVLNSSCDKISVIDAASRLIMRYIDLSPYVSASSFPEMIRIAPGNRFGYTLFNNGLFLQFDTESDRVTKSLLLGNGLWRSFAFDNSGSRAVVADWSGNTDFSGGKFILVDPVKMETIASSEDASDSIYFPMNVTFNGYNSNFYAACNTGNFLYKFQVTESGFGKISKVILDESATVNFQDNGMRPAFIEFINEGEQYAVICKVSGEVRIMNSSDNKILKVLKLGKEPQEIALAAEYSKMFISCMEDDNSFENGKGSVYVISTKDFTVSNVLYSGYQPKALVYDEISGLVYVANRNADTDGGDAPHHYTGCEGKNGYIRYIDAQKPEVLNNIKTEVLVDPYSMALKK